MQCARTLLKFSGIRVGRYGCKVLYKYGTSFLLLLNQSWVEREGRERGMPKKARGGRDSDG
jgi:hypothetical protein